MVQKNFEHNVAKPLDYFINPLNRANDPLCSKVKPLSSISETEKILLDLFFAANRNGT